MGRAGSPCRPNFFLTWVFSHVCSAGWSWRSSPPLMRSEPYSSSASKPLSPMREPSPPIWRPAQQRMGGLQQTHPSGTQAKCWRYWPANHRVAISNRRACRAPMTTAFNLSSGRGLPHRRPERYKVMTLDTSEFIRAFLMHVLPAGLSSAPLYGPAHQPNPRQEISLVPASCSSALIPIDAIKAASATPGSQNNHSILAPAAAAA